MLKPALNKTTVLKGLIIASFAFGFLFVHTSRVQAQACGPDLVIDELTGCSWVGGKWSGNCSADYDENNTESCSTYNDGKDCKTKDNICSSGNSGKCTNKTTEATCPSSISKNSCNKKDCWNPGGGGDPGDPIATPKPDPEKELRVSGKVVGCDGKTKLKGVKVSLIRGNSYVTDSGTTNSEGKYNITEGGWTVDGSQSKFKLRANPQANYIATNKGAGSNPIVWGLSGTGVRLISGYSTGFDFKKTNCAKVSGRLSGSNLNPTKGGAARITASNIGPAGEVTSSGITYRKTSKPDIGSNYTTLCSKGTASSYSCNFTCPDNVQTTYKAYLYVRGKTSNCSDWPKSPHPACSSKGQGVVWTCKPASIYQCNVFLDPKNKTINIGANISINATLIQSGGTNDKYTIASSKAGVLQTINSSGIDRTYKGIGAGTTTLTWRFYKGGVNKCSASATVTVKPIDYDCTGVRNVKWVACSNTEETGLTKNIAWKNVGGVVGSCTPRKCEYYVPDNPCGKSRPANSNRCTGDVSGPGDWHYVGGCSNARCEFRCKAEYTWDGKSKCVEDVVVINPCGGSRPANSDRCTGDRSGPGNWHYAGGCSNTRCEFKCKWNYTWDGKSKCVKNPPVGATGCRVNLFPTSTRLKVGTTKSLTASVQPIPAGASLKIDKVTFSKTGAAIEYVKIKNKRPPPYTATVKAHATITGKGEVDAQVVVGGKTLCRTGINQDAHITVTTIAPPPLPPPLPPGGDCDVKINPSDKRKIEKGASEDFFAKIEIKSGTVDKVKFSIINESKPGVLSIDPTEDDSSALGYKTSVTGNDIGTGRLRADVIMGGVVTCNSIANLAVPDNGKIEVVDPDAWWQVYDGDITSVGGVISDIPDSCTLSPVCDRVLIRSFSNASGVPALGGSLNLQGAKPTDEGWLAEGSEFKAATIYDYNYFDRKLGTTIETNPITTSSIKKGTLMPAGGEKTYNGYVLYRYSGTGPLTINADGIPLSLPNKRRVVLFVDEDLIIKGDIRVVEGKSFFMAIVKGNIIVDPEVGGEHETSPGGPQPDLEGIYFANGQFRTGTKGEGADDQLHIRGSVAGYGDNGAMDGILFQRDLSDNSEIPAELFQYAPDQILLIPRFLSTRRYEWREVAP